MGFCYPTSAEVPMGHGPPNELPAPKEATSAVCFLWLFLWMLKYAGKLALSLYIYIYNDCIWLVHLEICMHVASVWIGLVWKFVLIKASRSFIGHIMPIPPEKNHGALQHHNTRQLLNIPRILKDTPKYHQMSYGVQIVFFVYWWEWW